MIDSKQNTMLPVYLIVGDDVLKQRVVLKRLNDRLAKYGNISFNSETFDAEFAAGTQIVNACQTLPFASDKRLVIVNDVNKLKKADQETVVSYISNPNITTVLALVAEKLEKTTKLYKAVAALGKTAIIDCSTPKNYKMRDFIKEMASKTYSMILTDDACDKLLELVGCDTVRIDNELKKISFLRDMSEVVNLETIEEMVSRTSEAKPWDFVDAFSERNLAKTLSYFKIMPSSSPLSLLAMCVSRLRELACVKSLSSQGRASVDSIAYELKMPDWKVKNHLRYASNFAQTEICKAIVLSGEAERKMKSGANVDTTFTSWIVEVLKK